MHICVCWTDRQSFLGENFSLCLCAEKLWESSLSSQTDEQQPVCGSGALTVMQLSTWSSDQLFTCSSCFSPKLHILFITCWTVTRSNSVVLLLVVGLLLRANTTNTSLLSAVSVMFLSVFVLSTVFLWRFVFVRQKQILHFIYWGHSLINSFL